MAAALRLPPRGSCRANARLREFSTGTPSVIACGDATSLSEGGFGKTIKFSALPRAPSLRELAAKQTERARPFTEEEIL